jgi:glucose/arabinose dehydrogenase
MRFQRLLAIALLAAACGGGDDVGSAIDAARIDGPPGNPIDAPPAGGPDAAQFDCTPVTGTTIAMEDVAIVTDEGTPDGGYSWMSVLVTAPPGDRRLFVVARYGEIRIVKDGEMLATPFLDIDDIVVGGTSGDSEQGLLGLAFHPQYATNGRFYVYYTSARQNDAANPFNNVVAEYTVDPTNPDLANRASAKPLLTIPDPRDNHNGGMIDFGPDGKLWVGTGDGGKQGDPDGNAQNNSSLLGKILVLDVEDPTPEPVMWGKGLRNPWRWSFDPETGDLYVGDVGQGTTEEITVVASTATNVNFGWNRFEGDNTYPGQDPKGGNRAGITFPAVTHSQDEGWQAIAGGQVYRGSCFPDLVGWYFYTDYSKGELWKFRWVGGEAVDHARVLAANAFMDGPTSIHADAFGELYATDGNGQVKRIVVRP